MPVSSHVVLETGACTTRAGFAGDQVPKVLQPTVIGRKLSENGSEVFVGNDVQDKAKDLAVSCPISGGVITNWADMEALWTKVLTDQLGVKSQDHNVILLDSPVPDLTAREKIAKIMFESLNVQALFLANPAVLTCYSAGRLDGVVLQMGEGFIHAVPVVEGFAVPSAVRTWAFGGSGQTNYLGRLLKERGLSLDTDELRKVKESLCYVAEDFKAELEKSSKGGFEKNLKLSDEKAVSLGSEMFKTTEILFQPQMAGMSSAGVAAMIHDAVSQCSAEQQKIMYKNVILGGGPSLSPGFAERLKKELTSLSGQEVIVVAVTNRQHTAWFGGSILAVLPDFQSMWVSREEYKEKGAEIVHTKCK